MDNLSKRLKALRASSSASNANDSPAPPRSNKLVLEPKSKPQLTRAESGELINTDDSSLVDDLAAALNDSTSAAAAPGDVSREVSDLSRCDLSDAKTVLQQAERYAQRMSPAASSPDHKQEEQKEEEEQVDALMARLTALRGVNQSPKVESPTNKGSNAEPQDVEDDLEPSPFNLPSVPTAIPTLPSPPVDAHPTLGSAHADISSERDLSAFRKLVSGKMDVSKLSISDTPRGFGDQGGDVEEDGDPSDWCSICTEDATLSCFSPQDEDEGCAGDLYCSKCWVEGHERMGRDELRDHRTKEVRSKKKPIRRSAGGAGSNHTRKAMAA